MKIWITATQLVMFLALPAVAQEATKIANPQPRFEVEFELGSSWQTSNDVELPNDGTATRFPLRDLVGQGPWP